MDKCKQARVILAVFALSLVTQAQKFPDAPSSTKRLYFAPFKKWDFYAGIGAFSAAAVADVHSTKVCEANHTCYEAYKGHDTYRYIAPEIALIAGGTYGCQLMFSYHRRWRYVCMAFPILLSVQHWKDASTIYKTNTVARP